MKSVSNSSCTEATSTGGCRRASTSKRSLGHYFPCTKYGSIQRFVFKKQWICLLKMMDCCWKWWISIQIFTGEDWSPIMLGYMHAHGAQVSFPSNHEDSLMEHLDLFDWKWSLLPLKHDDFGALRRACTLLSRLSSRTLRWFVWNHHFESTFGLFWALFGVILPDFDAGESLRRCDLGELCGGRAPQGAEWLFCLRNDGFILTKWWFYNKMMIL